MGNPTLCASCVLLCSVLLSLHPAHAQDATAPTETLRLDGALLLQRFEQQVKTEVGGARGERLVEEFALNTSLSATYRVWGPIALGLYGRADIGTRKAARFQAFDENNQAITVGEVGGDFQELWLGPLVRFQWKTLFFETGYGLLGLRNDDARTDLASPDGDTSSALRTSRTIAWMAALGGGLPVTDSLQATLRLEYRVRYYDRRSSDALADDTVHGTQNFTPLVGVAWTPTLWSK